MLRMYRNEIFDKMLMGHTNNKQNKTTKKKILKKRNYIFVY